MTISFFILFTAGLMINLGACQNECTESRCGDYGPPIRFPFRLREKQPSHCGYPGFDLSCDRSNNTVLELPVSVKFFITSINYKSQLSVETFILAKRLRRRLTIIDHDPAVRYSTQLPTTIKNGVFDIHINSFPQSHTFTLTCGEEQMIVNFIVYCGSKEK
ncbi:hypothetical protein DVH24_006402 [Malus domestica]|uniref:RING-type E3 ubiquitin transferase n=1 Tax=Malus domestica TaxID=3750 RepID=A0A498KHB1_MALDO|nr:hypothetical protein DVH24_006402 [Malus domestica]